MSLHTMLEIAKTQNSVGPLADALAMSLDALRLHASTDILSDRAVKIAIEHATAEEAVTLVNNLLDLDDVASNIHVVESASGDGAVLIFNDPDQVELAALETAGVILEMSAGPMDTDDDDDEETHIVDEDTDADEDDDEDEDDEAGSNPDMMNILHTEEGFKLAGRLHALSCGQNKANFPKFMMDMDKLLSKHRNESGYDPSTNQETASILAEAFFASNVETAKKQKGFKGGRSGFLSAYMRIISKRGDTLADAWDALDPETMINQLSEAGKDLLDMMDDERQVRGLDMIDPNKVATEINQPSVPDVARVRVA